MSAELFALSSALLFALGNIIVRMGLRTRASPFNSTVMFLSSTALVWFMVLISNAALPTLAALPFFILRGILDPGLGAIFIFIALRNIGVALTIPIMTASTLLVTVLSVVFLGEKMTLAILIGTVLIIVGVTLLSINNKLRNIKKLYVAAAVLGSILIGLSNFMTKIALNVSDTVVSGLAITFTTGLVIHFLLITILKKWGEFSLKWKSARIFLLAGIIIAVAFLFSFYAFSTGLLSIVYPLISTQPLFALLFAYIFVRKDEIITKNIVLGTILVVLGASLVIF